MKPLWIALLLPFASAAFAGELDNNTITVTATQSADRPPSQASISVTLTVPATAGLDEVLGLLSVAGFTASDLGGIYSFNSNQGDSAGSSQWIFTHVVESDKLSASLASLTSLQRKLGKMPNGQPALSFNVFAQADDAAASCPFSSLLADARRRADTLAAAAGLRTGAIVFLSDGSSLQGATVPVAVFATANFLLGQLFAQPMAVSTCSLTVQFKLGV